VLTGFIAVKPLGATRVENGGAVAEDSAAVNVSQGPEVEAALLKVTQGAGRVGLVTGLAAGVAVEQGDLRAGEVGEGGKVLGQVLGDLSGFVADPVNRGNRLTVASVEDGLRAFRTEGMGALRPGEGRGPATERIVVAVDDVTVDTGLVKTLQPFAKGELGAQASVGGVVDIPGDEEKVNLLLAAVFHHSLPGGEGAFGRNGRAPPLLERGKGMVQMEVTGNNAGEHEGLFIEARGRLIRAQRPSLR
jgi:hypothetical protein